MSYSPTQYAAR